ncbi:unnamed protein product, partial [uncultured virus]
VVNVLDVNDILPLPGQSFRIKPKILFIIIVEEL